MAKTREQLEQEFVEEGVAKWGEAERAGLEAQARKKSLRTLKLESEVRGLDEDDAREHVAEHARKTYSRTRVARHACDDGIS